MVNIEYIKRVENANIRSGHTMKVLMFGWEFPPFSSGGLGTACLGLTKGLSALGVDVTFVIPKAPKGMQAQHHHVKLTIASQITDDPSIQDQVHGVTFEEVETLLGPYVTAEQYRTRYENFLQQSKNNPEDDIDIKAVYGNNLYDEVIRYAHKAASVSRQTNFDVIHAHDWLTYKAGIIAKRTSGKPLVLHIHATEFDRTGGHCNQIVYDIEREGFHAADKILAVSNLTRNTVINKYGVDPDKVTVVHNAVEFRDKDIEAKNPFGDDKKIVLFLGRITIQKGPEYFVHAAKRVLEKMNDVRFVVAGSGDMENKMQQLAKDLHIDKDMVFTGFLRGDDIDRAYKIADLYVMPSVSEPFGITPLEAMRNGTPALISKTSGVSEVVKHALKVDFWDINQMASKIISVLKHTPLHKTLVTNGSKEVQTFDWKNPAKLCVQAYDGVTRGHATW